MRPVLTGLFFCLGGVLGGGFFRLRSLDGGRLVSLGLVVGDNDLKIVVRGSGLGLGGRFVFAEGGDEVLQLGDGLLGLVDLLAPRQILGSVELFTDGVVAVIQLAQLDLGLLDLVFLGLDGNVGLCDGGQLLRLCGGSLGGLYGHVLCSFKIFRKTHGEAPFSSIFALLFPVVYHLPEKNGIGK